jgi:diadenosine tetraphosphatase ApaH/serine/threonine PP2A family protein phosphatase
MKPDNIAYLHDLTKGPERIDGFQIIHGSPLDEDEYVVSEQDVAQVAPYLDSSVSFFGHTHLQCGFLCHRNGVKRLRSVDMESDTEVLELEPQSSYLINPGSVGQPRDGDPRASFAIYQPDARLVTLCRAEYDVAAAQRKIRQAGLPEMLALRLEAGI